MLAAICEVAYEVEVGENSWLKLTAPGVVTEQFAVTVSPVQKIRDSGIVPLSSIACAVLAVTVPASTAPVVASVDE